MEQPGLLTCNPEFGRLRQKDYEFKASEGFKGRLLGKTCNNCNRKLSRRLISIFKLKVKRMRKCW